MPRGDSAAIRIRAESGTTDDVLLDVEGVARGLNADVVYEQLGADVSGVLIREESRVIIGVNQQHPESRQRFTVAHEIGHLVLHKGRALVVDPVRINLRDARSSMATDLEEIEANSFAAELLMPRSLVLRHYRGMADAATARSVKQLTHDLAVGFGVSDQAMEYRLAHLGLLRPE